MLKYYKAKMTTLFLLILIYFFILNLHEGSENRVGRINEETSEKSIPTFQIDHDQNSESTWEGIGEKNPINATTELLLCRKLENLVDNRVSFAHSLNPIFYFTSTESDRMCGNSCVFPVKAIQRNEDNEKDTESPKDFLKYPFKKRYLKCFRESDSLKETVTTNISNTSISSFVISSEAYSTARTNLEDVSNIDVLIEKTSRKRSSTSPGFSKNKIRKIDNVSVEEEPSEERSDSLEEKVNGEDKNSSYLEKGKEMSETSPSALYNTRQKKTRNKKKKKDNVSRICISNRRVRKKICTDTNYINKKKSKVTKIPMKFNATIIVEISEFGKDIFNFAKELLLDHDVYNKLSDKTLEDYLLHMLSKESEEEYKNYSSVAKRPFYAKYIDLLIEKKNVLLSADTCLSIFDLLKCKELNEIFISMTGFTFSRVFQNYKCHTKFKNNEKIKLMQTFYDSDDYKDANKTLDFLQKRFKNFKEAPTYRSIAKVFRLLYFLPNEKNAVKLKEYKCFLDNLQIEYNDISNKTKAFTIRMEEVFNNSVPVYDQNLILSNSKAFIRTYEFAQTKVEKIMNKLINAIKKKLSSERLLSIFLYLGVGGFILTKVTCMLRKNLDVYMVMDRLFKLINACKRIMGDNIFNNSSVTIDGTERSIIKKNKEILYLFMLYIQFSILFNYLQMVLNNIQMISNETVKYKDTGKGKRRFKHIIQMSTHVMQIKVYAIHLDRVFSFLKNQRLVAQTFFEINDKRIQVYNKLKMLKALPFIPYKHEGHLYDENSIFEIFQDIKQNLLSINQYFEKM